MPGSEELVPATERVVIFMDLKFFDALDNLIGLRLVHLDKLCRKLGAGRTFLMAYCFYLPVRRKSLRERYVAQQEPSDQVLLFWRAHQLAELVPRIRTWPEKCLEISPAALGMVEDACDDKYDTCVLITGDRYLAAAAKAVKSVGKRVEVAYVHADERLKEVADKFVLLDRQYLADCLMP